MKKIAFIIIVLATGLLFFTNCNGEKKYKEVVVEVFEDGFPQKVDYYIQDSILAKTVQYHSNHALYIEGTYKDQVRDGRWRSWRDNGILWSEAHYKKGVQTGKYRVFYENGQLYIKGHYKDGKHTGTWKFYDEDGELLKEVKY